MKNRLASLFELDELLGTSGNGHAARAPKKRKAPGSTTAAPRDPSPGYRPRRRKARMVDRNTDKGDPIRCEHAVPYKPVPPVDVQEPPPPPAASAPPTAQQLGEDEYDVEAFEEPDEDPDDDLSLQLPDIEDERLDSDDESSSIEQSYYQPGPRADAARALERRHPETFAAQMDAVERDLADLASRVAQPSADAGVPDTSQQDDETGAGPAPPNSTSGHGVFDQMAQGMAYATEFRLPAVQLSQVFSALDKELDAEERKKQTVSHAPPVVVQEPTAIPTPVAPATPAPDQATLIKDLVAMPCPPSTNPPAAGPPSPAAANPAAGANTNPNTEPAGGKTA